MLKTDTSFVLWQLLAISLMFYLFSKFFFCSFINIKQILAHVLFVRKIKKIWNLNYFYIQNILNIELNISLFLTYFTK